MNPSRQPLPDPPPFGGGRAEDVEIVRLLGIVVRGRASADGEFRAAGRRAWHELVTTEYDRVRALVSLFRFPDRPEVAIAESDRDDAVQEAFARLLRMVENFNGSSVGEFRAAVRTATNFACMDFCRRSLTRERRLAGSLEEPSEADEANGRFDHAIAQMAVRAHDERQEVNDRLDEVVAAFGELRDERQRKVVRLTAAGWHTDEIASAIQTTPANVHQLRSRALRQLRRTIG